MKWLAIIMALSLAATSEADDAAAVATDSEAATATETKQVSPLEELDWLTGDWVDHGEEATITTTCSWTHNGKFLKRAFRIVIDSEVTLEGTQFIGWDPLAGRIRSWTFDSEGGYGQGRWIQDGDRWLVKTAFVLAGGERASAINIITYVDQNTLRWQSTNREIARELQPKGLSEILCQLAEIE